MAMTTVRRLLDAPIDAVFEQISDHAGYAAIPGVKLAELTREGTTEPNGEGAQRHLKLDNAEVWEDIVGFTRPTLMEYRIVRMKPGILKHRLGRITLSAQGEQTDVTWTSEFQVKFPLLGRLLEKRIDGLFQEQFNTMLTHAESRARKSTSS